MNFSNSSPALADTFLYWCPKQLAGPLIWSAFSIVCFLLGFPVSVAVLYVLFRRKRHGVFDGGFSLSMAVIDLMLAAAIPFSVCNYMIWENSEYEWISNLIFNFSLTGRPLFMACVCGDCYFAVVHPIAYKTSKKAVIIKKTITVIVWMIVIGFCATLSSIAWMISTPWTSTFLVVALLVISFCNISVLRALRKPDPSGKANIHPQKKRALHTIQVSFFTTFIAYLPPAIIFPLGSVTSVVDSGWNCSLLLYGFCFSTAGCVIMPILYLVNVGYVDITKKWWKK